MGNGHALQHSPGHRLTKVREQTRGCAFGNPALKSGGSEYSRVSGTVMTVAGQPCRLTLCRRAVLNAQLGDPAEGS